jgi:hypothetical protein
MDTVHGICNVMSHIIIIIIIIIITVVRAQIPSLLPKPHIDALELYLMPKSGPYILRNEM